MRLMTRSANVLLAIAIVAAALRRPLDAGSLGSPQTAAALGRRERLGPSAHQGQLQLLQGNRTVPPLRPPCGKRVPPRWAGRPTRAVDELLFVRDAAPPGQLASESGAISVPISADRPRGGGGGGAG